MRTIELTKQKLAIVDDEDYEMLMERKWHAANRPHGTWYAQSAGRPSEPKIVMMHRIIMRAPSGVMVDHVNGDGLDNRKNNLRFASNRQNQQNSVRASSRLGLRGVTYHKKQGKFRTSIRTGIGRVWLGSFHSPEAAHAAYVAASKKIFGGFSGFNRKELS